MMIYVRRITVCLIEELSIDMKILYIRIKLKIEWVLS